ncbi:MAG: four helix bundle protein [Bacteroidota bacterium]
MNSYRDLIVWQKSMNLVTLIYKQTNKFPDDEKFGLTSQIKRSSVSIPSNIAEGYGRNYRKDYSRFLQISRGSLYECQTQLEIAVNLKFITIDDIKEINELSLEVEKMLNSLIKKINE